MSKEIFKEPLDYNFFSNIFGKKYIHKKEFINDANSVVNFEILDDMLSKSNIWNNKNFKMMLDQKTLNFNDYSSLSINITGSNNRPDVDKVQRLVSKGAEEVNNYSDLTENINCLFMCVSNTSIAKDIAKEIYLNMSKETLVIDITTHNKNGSIEMKDIFMFS